MRVPNLWQISQAVMRGRTVTSLDVWLTLSPQVKLCNETHPLDRILNGTCILINRHQDLLELAPDGIIPICGFMKILVFGSSTPFWSALLLIYYAESRSLCRLLWRPQHFSCTGYHAVGQKVGVCFQRGWEWEVGFTVMGWFDWNPVHIVTSVITS